MHNCLCHLGQFCHHFDVAVIYALVLLAAAEYRCIRWTWTGDVYNRRVVCLEWKKVEKK